MAKTVVEERGRSLSEEVDIALGTRGTAWLRSLSPSPSSDSSLSELLKVALPDKAAMHADWLRTLAQPSVCICSVEDVQRLDMEDISTLPVPPLVKSVFRAVRAKEAEVLDEHQKILDTTATRKRDFIAPLRDRNMQPPRAGSKYFQDVRSYLLILTREEIEAGVRIVAHRIETWAKGERVVLVGILKGAFMFLSDLCRALVRPYSVFFVEASSYRSEREQGGLQITAELSDQKFFDATSRKPHKIVLLDELLDNGKTMHDMKQCFLSQLKGTHTEDDILTCCLFSKQRGRDWPLADITGIVDLPDLWLVGYGLDDRGTKRGWTELFAMPKVKIVETIEKDEVERLLERVDDNAMLTAPHVFSGFELTFNHKQKYRISGLDTHGEFDKMVLASSAATARVVGKSDLVAALSKLTTVKGKYEQELRFSFIQENVKLVPEDDIFTGDNKLYAELRSRLRQQIGAEARRFGLPGPTA
mmetsp:Transcript_50981/g.119168  ORF Transcript_50981/g.119168 Transcript_50981/m.119168 type:complete len:474 (-) Transcript_50981:63-1484(-)